MSITTAGPPAIPPRAVGPAAAAIRVVVLDDHPAVRLGLRAALAAEPGLVHAGDAAGVAELHSLLYRADPDVILLHHRPPAADGLTLCHGIKARDPRRKVILHAAYADRSITVPAIAAGADGLVHRTELLHDLLGTVRRVARGERVLPDATPVQLAAAGRALDADDLPILAMLVDGTPHADIATTLGLEPFVLTARIRRMLARLQAGG